MRELLSRLHEAGGRKYSDEGVFDMCDFIESYLEVLTRLRSSLRISASSQERRIKKKLDEDIQSLTTMTSLLYTLGSENNRN